jgi:hypothetical protein
VQDSCNKEAGKIQEENKGARAGNNGKKTLKWKSDGIQTRGVYFVMIEAMGGKLSPASSAFCTC